MRHCVLKLVLFFGFYLFSSHLIADDKKKIKNKNNKIVVLKPAQIKLRTTVQNSKTKNIIKSKYKKNKKVKLNHNKKR